MNELSELGPIATALICVLVMVEEAGVPLPMFPGDLLLVSAGVMIAAGQVSPWVFLPCALASGLTGAMIGYAWTRRLGQPGLQALADRLHVRRHVDAAAARLRRSGATGVLVGRLLIPGTRVYTTLVAGGVGMRPGTFFRGLLPSVALWVAAFTGLGWLVGYPAFAYLHRLEHMLLLLLLQAAALVATVAVVRHVRPPRATLEATAARTLLAAATDVVVAAVLGTIGWAVSDARPVWESAAVCLALLAVALGSRLALGRTLGERVARLSYRDALDRMRAGAWLGRLMRRTISDA